eukprot:767257-Hanusia_phi.AAC.8
MSSDCRREAQVRNFEDPGAAAAAAGEGDRPSDSKNMIVLTSSDPILCAVKSFPGMKRKT